MRAPRFTPRLRQSLPSNQGILEPKKQAGKARRRGANEGRSDTWQTGFTWRMDPVPMFQHPGRVILFAKNKRCIQRTPPDQASRSSGSSQRPNSRIPNRAMKVLTSGTEATCSGSSLTGVPTGPPPHAEVNHPWKPSEPTSLHFTVSALGRDLTTTGRSQRVTPEKREAAMG